MIKMVTLTPNVAFQKLDAQAHAMSDNDAAQRLNDVRAILFNCSELEPKIFMRNAMTNPEIDTTPRWQVILRWILFLPASVVSYIVVDSLFFNFSSWNLGRLSHIPNVLPASGINFLQSSLPLVFGGCAGGIALIVIGAAIAPRFRSKVCLALLVLNTCFFALTAGAILVGLLPTEHPALAVISEFVGSMVGIFFTSYFVIRRVGWESNAPLSRLWRPERPEVMSAPNQE